MPDAETIAEWKALSDGCAEEWADLITEKKGIDGKAYLAKAKELISGY